MDDGRAMDRALALGQQGRATSPPNPWVGCVVLKSGEIVGEGYHRAAGEPHAEVNALGMAGDRAQGATAFVTLEPCAHTGRTPPCTDALIAAGVTRVVAAVLDPDTRVAGGGVAALRAAGLRVDVGVGEAEARDSLAPYLHQRTTGLPWIVLKAAESLDGRTAAADGTSRWISGAGSRADAHYLRQQSQAIVVGAGTALADSPSLTVRDVDPPPDRQPLRVLLDARGRVPATGPLFETQTVETLVVTTSAAPKTVVDGWRGHGAEVVHVPSEEGGGVDLRAAFTLLAERGVVQALVEGGAALLGACIRSSFCNRLIVYLAPLMLGEQGRPLFSGKGPGSMKDAMRWQLLSVRQIDSDVRLEYGPDNRVPRGCA